MPNHLTINQLIELIHNVSYKKSLGEESRIVFFDISKAFDKVWHRGLISKLKKTGLSNLLIKWFKDYLSNRVQRVVIKGDTSVWEEINCGVPQGSVLGPLLFLIYINDLIDVIKNCSVNLFADDTCIYYSSKFPNSTVEIMNDDLQKISDWSNKWLVKFNCDKTVSLVISNKNNDLDHDSLPQLLLDGVPIKIAEKHKHLGVIINNKLSWSDHINFICEKSMKRLDAIRSLKYKCDRHTLEIFYFSFVRPILEYGQVLYAGTYLKDLEKINKVETEAMKIVTGAIKGCSTALLHLEAGWDPISNRRKNGMLIMMYKIVNRDAPVNLLNIFDDITGNQNRGVNYDLRSTQLRIPFCKTKQYKNSFFPYGIKLWNLLPNGSKTKPTLLSFKSHLKKKEKPKKLYYFGNRKLSVHHAKIRMGCSNLNSHLSLIIHVKDSPACSCGFPVESPKHYFLNCPLHARPRAKLLRSISEFTDCNINVILFGDRNLSLECNKNIFQSVHNYMKETKRFD